MSSLHGDERNPIDTTGLCLLSLDGGGVRGLSTLFILKRIMDRLNHERMTTAGLPPVKPCEVFDLIGGTSTGGLIAIMLGRLEMNVDDCIVAYSGLAEAVFSQKKRRLPFNLMGKVTAQFDSSKLENAIRETIKMSGFSETDLLNDGAERGCRTFVCTVDRNTRGIVRLRSYSLPDESSIPATICQAALATSAATTFFEPVRIGNRTFADGGLGANNPVDEVEGEAANIWCSESGDLKPLVKCFLSIGTGDPGINAFEESVFKFLGQTLVKIATETEETERRFIAKWRKHFDENRYFRFNVDQGLQTIGLDEYKQQGVMESATERYLLKQAQKNRVRDCIENLRTKQNKTEISFATLLDEFRIFELGQEASMQKVQWMVPFDKNRCFTGREPELAHLEKMLFTEDQPTKIAVFGLGGVGKTSLVIELLYRIKANHKDCSIFWIPATDYESLQQAYSNICRQLQLPGWDKENADTTKLLQKHLSHASAGQWLLVLDSADDINMWIKKPGSQQDSKHLMESLPKSPNGRIVFTTRDRKTAYDLVQRQENTVEVPELSEAVAKHLLKNYVPQHDLGKHEKDVKSFLEQLTYLPLAIVQAASYINKNGIPLAEYLSLLAAQEEVVIELLSEHFEDDWRYRNVKNPVATTWLISFEQIRARDPLAADFLAFMACVDSKNVPLSLLPPGLSPKKETDALGTLDAYSFINRRQADTSLDIHRLVHLAMRNWLRRENLHAHWTGKAVERLADVFPNNEHQNRNIWRKYLTHACYALDSPLVDRKNEKRFQLGWKVGICLYSDGRWGEAEVLFLQAIEIGKALLGQEHPETLLTMANLATTYGRQGRLKEAEDLELLVIDKQKWVLGQEHPDTLISMSNLASTYGRQSRLKEAEDLGLLVVNTRKRVLGQEHPKTLISMSSLALTYGRQSRLKEAEDLGLLVVNTQKRVLGQEHPNTMISMSFLASIYFRQARWKEGEDLALLVIDTEKRVLGQKHPDTLITTVMLAFMWKQQGRTQEAVRLLKECVELYEQALGVDSPQTSNVFKILRKWQTET